MRFLSELGLLDAMGSRPSLSAQLASYIDFAASIKLATALARPGEVTAQPGDTLPEPPRELFLRLRSAIIRSLLAGFAARPGYTHLKLPALGQRPPEDAVAGYAPYLRFYSGQQRMMEAKVLNLHLQVRDAAAMLSPALAQLCALDSELGDTLASHGRKAFAHTPRLLEQRFCSLLEQCRRQEGDIAKPWASWQQQFHSELREALLAELDARLLPTLGLVEATDSGALFAATNENRESTSL